MKRQIFLAALLAFLLSGCMNAVQLGERTIVQAVGVDLAENGGYRVTFQISGDGGAEKDASSGVYVAEENGPSMSEIMTRAASTQGKQIFLGSCQLVVLGAETAEVDVTPILDFFNANHRINPSMTVALAAGTAEEVLRAVEETPALSAQRMVDMIRNAYLSGFSPRAHLMDVLGAQENGSITAALPVLAFSQGAEEETSSAAPEKEEPPAQDSGTPSESSAPGKPKKSLDVSRMGLLYGGRLADITDLSAARGFAWTQNQIKSTALTAADGALGRVSVVTSSQKASLSAEQVADLMVFNIEVKVQGAAMEVLLRDGSRQMDENEREYAQALLEEEITEEIQHMIQSTQRKGWDILGVSLLARQRYPDFYQSHEDDWAQTIADSGYNVEVSFEINRSGVDTANTQ